MPYKTKEAKLINARAWKANNKEKVRSYIKQWRYDNRDRLRAINYERAQTPEYKEKKKIYRAKKHREARAMILEKYGNKCVCCGESRYEFLTIDHKNGGGNAHRREITGAKIGDSTRRGVSTTFQRWIIKNNYPDMLQILCHNCNYAKGFYGKCPHEEGRHEKEV